MYHVHISVLHSCSKLKLEIIANCPSQLILTHYTLILC